MLGCKTFVDGKIQNPEKHKSVENGDDAKKVRDAPCVLGDKRPLISDEAFAASSFASSPSSSSPSAQLFSQPSSTPTF